MLLEWMGPQVTASIKAVFSLVVDVFLPMMFTSPYAGMTRTGSTVDDPAGRPLSPRSEADSRVDEYEIVPGERTPASRITCGTHPAEGAPCPE
ncbi:hypothetical protein GCM10009831_28250 [Dietzia cercidiphylli]|uniref:Uncharacterized protein n=1 Tax=Dietzia cercidiphylli TaxID=498199 RepID=A0ABP4V5A8_9ACTN